MGAPLEVTGSVQRRLIINADDFGLTSGINRAVLELNRAGVLTSATLMAAASAFRGAVHEAFVQPQLSVGCHVVLVDGSPILHSSELPTLAPGGSFRPTLGGFLRDLLCGRIREREIEAEAQAQIARVQSAGITVSHLDSHKHTHIFARVLRPLLRAAVARAVPAIRNPFEPPWAMRAAAAAGWKRRLQVRLLGSRRGAFLRAVRRFGLHTTDGALGVLATGSLDGDALRRLLAAIEPGIWELVCHPGYADAALEQAHTRLVDSRETERTALLEEVPAARDGHSGIELISFEQLPGLNLQPPGLRQKAVREHLS